MDDVAVARALHVLGVVLWIGGVGFATMALVPALRHLPDSDQHIAVFERVERRFARVARWSIIVVGATGLYMIIRLDAWSRFRFPQFWWMHAMVLVWVLFALLLFVAEPLVLHRRFPARAKEAPGATFRAMQRFHWFMLIISLVTILGAVAGSHGLLLGS